MNGLRTILLCLVFTMAVHWSDGAEIAIVVNKENPVEKLSLKQLSDVFEMKNTDWKEWKNKKIYLVLMESGETEHDVMLDKVYDRSEAVLTKYWKELVFTHRGTPPKQRFKSNKEVKFIVSSNPQTIGYINADEKDDSVKVLRIDGLLPGEPGYPLKTE